MTARTSCIHRETRSTVSSYYWPVAEPPYTAEEPRAHGGITITRECLDCGARRAENHNSLWMEVGVWTRAHLRDLAAAERTLRSTRRPAPVTLYRPDGRTFVLDQNEDGYVLCPSQGDDGALSSAAAASWLSAAQAYRRAVLAVEDAQRHVAQSATWPED